MRPNCFLPQKETKDNIKSRTNQEIAAQTSGFQHIEVKKKKPTAKVVGTRNLLMQESRVGRLAWGLLLYLQAHKMISGFFLFFSHVTYDDHLKYPNQGPNPLLWDGGVLSTGPLKSLLSNVCT